MVFHSYTFLFLFLPTVLFLNWIAAALKKRSAKILVICAANIAFYASWGVDFLPFLIGAAVLNFSCSTLICYLKRIGEKSWAARIAALGVSLNVAFLVLIKYQSEIAALVDDSKGWTAIYFPIGISFITFIQIAYLIETYVYDDDKADAATYFAFSTFFPFITSGPIVSARETLPQIQNGTSEHLTFSGVTSAIALFTIGLFKKLVIADTLAPYADAAFGAAAAGQSLSIGSAWSGALAYAFQLYFDFSGYCDMAIALGFLLGVRLPLNFNSPFRSSNVAEFWQRWHMTLTRFITNYLYLPFSLKLARMSDTFTSRQARFLITTAGPIILVFLIAGVWHGTGWTFVLYGLYWGVVIALYHWFRSMTSILLPRVLSCALTMLVVLVALVIFRSENIGSIQSMLASMFNFGASSAQGNLDPLLVILLTTLGVAVIALPNSQQIVGNPNLTLDEIEPMPYQWQKNLLWRPSAMWGIGLASMLVAAVLMGGGPSHFLYYRF